MIDARELRIGNLIYWNIPNKTKRKIVHEVKAIINPTLHTCPISLGRLDENGYIGIQLTEEWLLKFGFQLLTEKRVGTKYSEYGNGQIHYEKRFNMAKHSEKDYWYCLRGSVKIQYVHQLQNLYFALTGEELTIKL